MRAIEYNAITALVVMHCMKSRVVFMSECLDFPVCEIVFPTKRRGKSCAGGSCCYRGQPLAEVGAELPFLL